MKLHPLYLGVYVRNNTTDTMSKRYRIEIQRSLEAVVYGPTVSLREWLQRGWVLLLATTILFAWSKAYLAWYRARRDKSRTENRFTPEKKTL